MENEISPGELGVLRQQHEAKFRDLLVGKTLETALVYTFEGQMADQIDDASLLIVGGIDLHFNGTVVCVGFNLSMELLGISDKEFARFSPEAPLAMIPKSQVAMFDALENKIVESAAFRWVHYFELDEDFEPVKTPSFAPTEVLLTFEGGEVLQMASLHFTTTPEGEMQNPTYNPEGPLLIARTLWTEIQENNEC